MCEEMNGNDDSAALIAKQSTAYHSLRPLIWKMWNARFKRPDISGFKVFKMIRLSRLDMESCQHPPDDGGFELRHRVFAETGIGFGPAGLQLHLDQFKVIQYPCLLKLASSVWNLA